MSESRTSNSVKNSLISFACQLLTILFSFANRTVFIKLFNADYLGVSGLFTNILTVLSLAELGVGTAIIFAMYKPAADGNKRKLIAYLNYYKKIYNTIGVIIFLAGLCLVPFLDVLIKEPPAIQENISIIYVLVLLDTSVSYFFTYKKSMLLVYQKNRIAQEISTIFILIRYILQILVLFWTRSYYFYLIAQVLVTLASNLFLSFYVDRKYSFIKQYKKERLLQEEKYAVKKNVLAMAASKIGSVAVNGTDNILISAFIGTTAVALYSNYVYVINYAKLLLSAFFTQLTSSVGNLIADSDKEKVYSKFKTLYFLSFSFASFSTVLLFVLIDPFIDFWVGDQYVIQESVKILVIANYYISFLRIIPETFIDAFGLFWQIKWKSIVEAIINLFVSWFLVSQTELGLTGIIIGTIVSNVSTNLWWEPFVIYRYGFNKKMLPFFMSYFIDILFCLCSIIVCTKIAGMITIGGFGGLVVKGIICVAATAILYLACYAWRREFKNARNLIVAFAHRKVKRISN